MEIAAVAQLDRAIQPFGLNHEREDAVVGPDEQMALLRQDRERLALASNAGIDDGNRHGAGGIELHGLLEYFRGGLDVVGRDLMREIHDAKLWRDAPHDALAHRDRAVLHTEVREEENGRRRTRRLRRLWRLWRLRPAASGREQRTHHEHCGARGGAHPTRHAQRPRRAPRVRRSSISETMKPNAGQPPDATDRSKYSRARAVSPCTRYQLPNP